MPSGVLIFDATDQKRIIKESLLRKLAITDTTLRDLDFTLAPDISRNTVVQETQPTAVVEVEYGEHWIDYRPARPEHFVGRKKIQRSLFKFFSDVKQNRTPSRVFAIKGDSGIGKSSLVVKLNETASESKKPSKLFYYAVDVRAANDSSYVYASLLSALRNASEKGFGNTTDLEISNYADPIQSQTVLDYLSECERKNELIILVFDQFEELYSKPDLFSIFEEIKKLMFSVLSASTNLVLGFAWKTDSTVPQEHPAYHMWHQLADHRYEIFLTPFAYSDAEQSILLFENELGEKLRPELRRYIIENSQGYPWLLKKLCIHLYEQLEAGTSQSILADRTLDIASLFDRDLNDLTPSQMACLKLVAKNAPMDWYEVLEAAGADVVQNLQQKRLLIRRGDKLNLYWDIFRDYVIAGTIPSIPFTYIPQATSIVPLLRVALQLDPAEAKKLKTLSQAADLSEKSVWNIVHDLEQFGIARVESNEVFLDSHIKDLTSRAVLSKIRIVFRRHALTELLRNHNSTEPANQNQIVDYLKQINPAAQHRSRTWNTYANRMCIWMTALGYLKPKSNGFLFLDQGDIAQDEAQRFRGERRRVVFIGDASPARVIEALEYLQSKGPQPYIRMKSLGFRNACAVLYRFRLIEVTPTHDYQVVEDALSGRSPIEGVWEEAEKEDGLVKVIEFLKSKPSASTVEIGRVVAKQFDRDWTESSCIRVGNSLRQWAIWLISGNDRKGFLPDPPGKRSDSVLQNDETFDLFSLSPIPSIFRRGHAPES